MNGSHGLSLRRENELPVLDKGTATASTKQNGHLCGRDGTGVESRNPGPSIIPPLRCPRGGYPLSSPLDCAAVRPPSQ